MAVVPPSTGGKAPVLADDLYVVTCTGVEEQYVEEDQYDNHEKLVFHLKVEDVLDEEGKDIVLDPRINKKWSEKSTLFAYAQAFGLNANPGEPIDTDVFVGKKVKALIETETPGTWPRVKSLVAIRGNTATAATTTKVSEDKVTAFWTKVRGAGFTREEVAPYVDGDLLKIPTLSEEELDKILTDMGLS